MNPELLIIAQLGKSVGLKGYLKLHNKSDFLEQFKSGAVFDSSKGLKLKIKHFDRQRELVLFEGYESVELAKTLTNSYLYSSKERSKKELKLKKDEYFYFDIIGLKVLEDEQNLGEVVDILETGAGFLLLVKSSDEFANLSKEFYLPYVNRYIQKVDIASGHILASGAKELLASLV